MRWVQAKAGAQAKRGSLRSPDPPQCLSVWLLASHRWWLQSVFCLSYPSFQMVVLDLQGMSWSQDRRFTPGILGDAWVHRIPLKTDALKSHSR